jgi:plastocyanin
MRPLALALPLALLAACAASDDDGASAATAPCSAATAAATGDVAVTALQFIPYCARTAPGGAVTFTNLDWEAHTVTADAAQAESFDSGLLYPGMTYTHVFRASGATVRVHCRLHPAASGRVLVVP